MPIIKKSLQHENYGQTEELFKGRVVRFMQVTETRNWSDTMDYTDFRSTQCNYALVWLGGRGLPPRPGRYNRPMAYIEVPSWDADKVRTLEPHEQFAWVDCTNIFSDRCGYSLEVKADPFDMQLLHGGPEMLENLKLWDAHQVKLAAEAAAHREAEEAAARARRDAEEAKAAARRAATEARDAVGRAAAEALLAHLPKKGSPVTVGTVAGKLQWTGAKKFRGQWQARVGVKDARGEMHWFDAAQVSR